MDCERMSAVTVLVLYSFEPAENVTVFVIDVTNFVLLMDKLAQFKILERFGLVWLVGKRVWSDLVKEIHKRIIFSSLKRLPHFHDAPQVELSFSTARARLM